MRDKRRKSSAAAAVTVTVKAGTSSRFLPSALPPPPGESQLRKPHSFTHLIQKEIESARDSDPIFPQKFWIKQQFAVGANEVTRILERMPPHGEDIKHHSAKHSSTSCINLQAIMLAIDCNPRLLAKHLPVLASSRGVPVIFIKDRKEGSLRLGELLKLKTAIVIGIKANGNTINRLVDELLASNTIES